MIDFDKPRSQQSEDAAQRLKEKGVDTDLAFELEEIELKNASDPALRASREKIKKLNGIIAFLVVCYAGLAAIPIASARPIYWMGWSAVIALTLALYYGLILLIHPERPARIRQVMPLLMLASLLPLWGVVQYLGAGPLHPLLGGLGIDSVAPQASLLAAIRMFGHLALFVLAYEVASRVSRVTAMAWGLFGIIILHAAFGLIALTVLDDFSLGGEKASYLGAATGTFINRNSFATFLGMGFILGIALAMAHAARPQMRRSRKPSLLSEASIETAAIWFGVVLVGAATIATQSRLGTVAVLVASLVVVYLMRSKRDKKVLGGAMLVALISLVAIILITGVFGRGLFERGLFVIGALEARGELYVQVLKMISQNPFTGGGLDGFYPALDLAHEAPLSSAVVWRFAHSTYLGLWQEGGLVFGSAPIVAVALAGWKLWGKIRRRGSDYAIPVAAFGAIILVAIHSTLDFSMEIQANVMVFAVLIAMGLGQGRQRHRRR